MLAAAVLVLLGLALVGLGHVAAATVDRARAQQAADAAALAAAVRLDPGEVHRVAAVVADHNDAEVVEVRRVGIIVVVTVRSGSARATAAARPAPGTW